tara:strand:+ start:174 stop:368 length:195 start_codon:yes stop_codon:yes gene_type:complete
MTMKFTQLKTHWDASDAYAIITFLDELKEVLCIAYAEDIKTMLQESAAQNQQHHDNDKLEENDF